MTQPWMHVLRELSLTTGFYLARASLELSFEYKLVLCRACVELEGPHVGSVLAVARNQG